MKSSFSRVAVCTQDDEATVALPGGIVERGGLGFKRTAKNLGRLKRNNNTTAQNDACLSFFCFGKGELIREITP